MTHIPLCTVRGCPDPTNKNDFHRCFVCGKAEGDHQHVPKLKMGGKNPDSKIVAFLCRYHHDKIDNGLWMNQVKNFPDGNVHYFVLDARGDEKCDRVIGRWKEEESPPPDEPREALPTVKVSAPILELALSCLDPSDASDEQLAAMFQEGDNRQAEGFLLKCRVVQAYRERHIQHWGESWLENAYDLFHVSRRTLFAYANIGVLVDKADTYLVENIGPLTSSRSLMTHIGRKALPDGKVALEAAVTHLAKFGESPTVAALEHRLGVEAKPPETCPVALLGGHEWQCKYCGKER